MRRYALLAAVALASPTLAAEGMWLPSQAPKLAAKLKAEGLELPAAALADLNRAPMSAIASLGGCSASFVSPQGLVVTNHHCIYGSIQVNSRPDRDLIKNGFLAKTMAEELPATPSARVFVIDALDDVTAQMTAGVAQLTGAARDAKLAANRKAVIAACEATPGRRCDVRSYFGGAQYWRQTMLEIRDVRLVYAPAEGVGNFGGETDNWQWPRHTGDFGFYRAYVGPDGKPAAPSPNNVPYRPKAWLKMATGDLKAGDFVMIAGFPGVTERYRTHAETERWYGDIYPTQQRLLAEYSDLIGREAKTDGERILYANLLKGADNYKKKILGQIDAAKKADLVSKKRSEGAALGEWAALPANRNVHALAISNYDSLIDQNLAAERGAIVSATLNRAQLLRAARLLYRWANERELADAAREPGYQDRDRQTLVDQLNLISRQYDPRIDQAIFAQALSEYRKLPADSRNAGLDAALPQNLGALYAGTKLGDPAERLAWLDRPASAFRTSDDPFIKLAVAAYAGDRAAEAKRKDLAGRMDAVRVPYMKTVEAYAASKGQLLYPDANGSLRFTYGKVTGRPAADGTIWTPFTTTRGILEKDRGEGEFESPKKLLELARAKDFGPYASKSLGTLPVNFLSTTDITNGNSGSAILNGRGELVGLAFDGTIEGMLSDWAVDPATNVTIGVDARYMAWVMDKVDGAGHLLREMREGR